MMNTHELAWAAGFFDGEGSVWWRPPVRTGARPSRGGRGHVRVSIQQCDPTVLHRFRDAVGVGRVRGPFSRHAENAAPYWNYEAHRFTEVIVVIGYLWRFLSPIKRTQLATSMRSLLHPNHDLLGA